MVIAFVHGFLLSLGLILPIGMQNGFILTQGALHKRWSNALPAVLTAAICDTLLIALSVIGVSTVALHITWLRYTLGSVGILFLIYMGRATWKERDGKSSVASASTAWNAKRQITFTASVSLLNPHALIDTLAVLGGSALAYPTWSEKISFGIASVVVSWIWFFGLSIAGHHLGRLAVGHSSLRMLDRMSALMMWASAIYLGYVIYSYP